MAQSSLTDKECSSTMKPQGHPHVRRLFCYCNKISPQPKKEFPNLNTNPCNQALITLIGGRGVSSVILI